MCLLGVQCAAKVPFHILCHAAASLIGAQQMTTRASLYFTTLYCDIRTSAHVWQSAGIASDVLVLVMQHLLHTHNAVGELSDVLNIEYCWYTL